MPKSQAAKTLGRLGGLARRKTLTPERLQDIARQGAQARKESFRLSRIILSNFEHLNFIDQFRPPGRVISESTCAGPLPSIHDETN